MAQASSGNLYSPVLRWKRGEIRALQQLDAETRRRVVPIVELVQRPLETQLGKKKRGEVLHNLVGGFEEARGSLPFYLDLHRIPGLLEERGKPHPLETIGAHAIARGVRIIPVLRLGNGKGLAAAAASLRNEVGLGLCLRISKDDWARPDLEMAVNRILVTTGVAPEDVDLVLDYELVDEGGFDHPSVVSSLPHLKRWRRMVALSGAFPRDLSALAK